MDINLYKIYLKTSVNEENNRLLCTSYNKQEIIGEFTIDTNSVKPDIFKSIDLLTMSIYLDVKFQGKGIARKMINLLLLFIEQKFEVRYDKMLFIDTDASVGFWDYLGMKPNRYYDRCRVKREGWGYEKVITWNELKKWCLH